MIMCVRISLAKFKEHCREGAVYYFQHRRFTSPSPHYFIVVNNPTENGLILLTVASSQIPTVKLRRISLPRTVVEISVEEYSDFTKDSIIDCNNVFNYSEKELFNKLNTDNIVEIKSNISARIIKKLKDAILRSPLVEDKYKKLLS